MKHVLPWIVLGGLMLLPSIANGQAYDAVEENQVVGPWLSDRAWEGLMNKMADNVAQHYNFDENQRTLTRDVFQNRIYNWLGENRDDIIPLVNTWIESSLSDTPPSIEEVSEWAQKVAPLKDDFSQLIGTVADDMSMYMTEEQQVKLKAEMAAFEYSMDVLTDKLDRWSDGEFDAATEWPGSEGFEEAEKQRQAEMNMAMTEVRQQALEKNLGDKTFREKLSGRKTDNDPWARYVNEFIKKYELTAEQQLKAQRHLEYHIKNRDKFLDANAKALDQIEYQLAVAETDADKAKWRGEYDKKAVAIETMFKVLKQKLEKLPTRAQRQAAEAKEVQKKIRSATK